MKERPILFSAPMVRALLAGTKTQTRRVVKPQPVRNERGVLMWGVSKHREIGFQGKDIHPDLHEHCPYGAPGDRLWVRESTYRRPMRNLLTGAPLAPEYDGGAFTADDEDVLNPEGFDVAWWYSRRSCPSIHMPRWACRLVLEITGVRVERLQDISVTDAWAEGVPHSPDVNPAHEFQALWESINGAESWEANPWVWAISFQRIGA